MTVWLPSAGMPFLSQKHGVINDPNRIKFEFLTINFFADHNISELHFVASECTCLISENILDLPQLFIYADCPATHRSVIDSTVHLLVSGHKVALEDFNEFNRDDQTDWDECAIQDEIGSEGYPHLLCAVDGSSSQHSTEIVLAFASEIAVNCTSETAKYLKGENDKYNIVDFCLNIASFGRRLASIHHDSCILPCVHNNAYDPVSVFKFAPSQHHVLFVYALWYHQTWQLELYFALKSLNLGWRLNATYFAHQTLEFGAFTRRVILVLHGSKGKLGLKILLSIKRGCFYIGDSRRTGTNEDKSISRNDLIFLYFDDISTF